MKNVGIPPIYLYRQIVEAKLYIDRHFEEKIDLGAIASEACFSKFHFHRTFKECYGKTPLEYLTYLRLREAKKLLSEGISTREVCYSVGFESTSSFIKLFKRKEQLTPSEFAKTRILLKDKAKIQPLNYIPGSYAEYLGWKP